MKYKNITNKDMSFKINDEWIIVNPGKVVELTRNGLNNKGLEVVNEKNVISFEFNIMTRDELYEYAINNGLKNVHKLTSKDDMIEMLKNFCNDESSEVVVEKISKDYFDEMTKDELNDFGALNNIDINHNMKKSTMIKKILGAL